MIAYRLSLVPLLVASIASAQKPVVAVGTWRGTSLCTLHPSACHDETVVYRVSQVGKDSLSMDARKIVNGSEQEMGVLACTPRGAQVVCVMPNGTWNFTVRGDSLVGDLRLPDNRKFRDVRAVRAHD